jgi:hypothetical protein
MSKHISSKGQRRWSRTCSYQRLVPLSSSLHSQWMRSRYKLDKRQCGAKCQTWREEIRTSVIQSKTSHLSHGTHEISWHAHEHLINPNRNYRNYSRRYCGLHYKMTIIVARRWEACITFRPPFTQKIHWIKCWDQDPSDVNEKLAILRAQISDGRTSNLVRSQQRYRLSQ